MAALDFEQKVIKAIQDGDLKELKHCCISKNDVNRPIFITQDVPIVSKSKQTQFQSIRAPTPLIYAILCEQDEILKYLLDVKHPNLSIRVNGWAPIHYAAYTYDHKCLELLLKYEYIQENIDVPVDEPPGIKTSPGYATTALHIAATNRRHANAILLTMDFDSPEFGPNGEKIVSQGSTDDGDTSVYHHPANPCQKSAFGNLPIHIAAKQRDWDMCQILLNACDDTTVRNDAGKTPADIARSEKCEDLAKKIESNSFNTIDVLKKKYLREESPVPKKKHSKKSKDLSDESEEYDEYSESVSQSAKNEIQELKKTVLNLSHIIQQLTARVSLLEAQRNDWSGNSTVVRPSKPLTHVETLFKCHTCGSNINTKQCSQCKFYYCDACWSKVSHPCSLDD